MKYRNFSTWAGLATIITATACSGFDEAGEDETVLQGEEPLAEFDPSTASGDDPALDAKERDLEPDETGTETLALALGRPKTHDHDISVFGGNLFAENFPYQIGRDCSPGHVRSGTPQTQWTSQQGGSCGFQGWVNPSNPRDCRASILAHTGGGFFGGTCQSWVFEEREPIIVYFSTTGTNSAQVNTFDQALPLDAGDTVSIGTCGLPGASFSGDTYLRLFDPVGNQLAASDDACSGLGSRFGFTAPSPGTFEVRAGCFGNASCSGVLVIQ